MPEEQTQLNTPDQEAQNTPPEAAQEQPKKKKGTVHKVYLTFIVLLLLVAGGMYLWKDWSEQKLQDQFSQEKVQLIEKTNQIISEKTEDFLELTATPLMWAVRAEMIRENTDQINTYLSQLIKEKEVKQIIVARVNGEIVSATDKKFEGENLADFYPRNLLSLNQVSVTSQKDGSLLVAAPILGISERLGILLFVFIPEPVVEL